MCVFVCVCVEHVDLLKVLAWAHLEIASHKFIAYSRKPKYIEYF